MDLELYAAMAAIVLAVSVLTVLLAVVVYILFRIEESRTVRQRAQAPAPTAMVATKSQFFKPVDVSRAL